MAEFVHKSVCVFCASSTQIDQIYIKSANELAAELVKNDIGIRYGGGQVGLMGELANCALSLGGRITGVIPNFMVEVEWQHKNVEDMILVETMHQRKNLLIQNVDAVIALPGSTGTLEELIEVISLKKLGLFSKPIIIINTNGFYNPLIEMLHKMIKECFMREEHKDVCHFIDKPKGVVELIKRIPEWFDEDRKLAAL